MNFRTKPDAARERSLNRHGFPNSQALESDKKSAVSVDPPGQNSRRGAFYGTRNAARSDRSSCADAVKAAVAPTADLERRTVPETERPVAFITPWLCNRAADCQTRGPAAARASNRRYMSWSRRKLGAVPTW